MITQLLITRCISCGSMYSSAICTGAQVPAPYKCPACLEAETGKEELPKHCCIICGKCCTLDAAHLETGICPSCMTIIEGLQGKPVTEHEFGTATQALAKPANAYQRLYECSYCGTGVYGPANSAMENYPLCTRCEQANTKQSAVLGRLWQGCPKWHFIG